MKLAVIAISIVMTIPGAWAQRYPKRPANLGPDGSASSTLKIRSLRAHARAVRPEAAPTPAPIVVQVFLDPSSGTLAAYAVVTATIPASSQITGGMTLLDDGSSIDFQQVPLQSALNPGDFFRLPAISDFGDLWTPGAFDYTVQVIPVRGASTQADGIFLVGETFANSDLTNPQNQPIIASASQAIASNKDVILKFPGFYTGDPVQVVLSDLFANYVAPASAITVSATEVDVDLSQIPAAQGFDMTSLDGLLVTISEDNVGDTIAFRYVPPAPGTFTPQQ